jgi:signal transduction histidine kinase
MALRFKIVAAIAGLIMILGLGGTLHARLTLSGISEDELEQRALAVAAGLQAEAARLLLTNDIYGLYARVNDVARYDDDLRYVVVLDGNGNVTASTFGEGLPAGLREANPLPSAQQYAVADISTNEGPVMDVAYPIGDGNVGIIRLGLEKDRLQGNVDRLTFTLLALTGGVLLAGLLVGYVLATILTRPLSRLADAAQAVGQGKLSQKIAISSRDEVGKLTEAFNAMTEKLGEKEEERSQILARIIAAQEEERQRIARELHDEAGQALTSLLLGLTHLERSSNEPAARTKAAELRSQTAEAIDLMRDIALELRPTTLDDLGLVAALQRYVADYGRKHSLDADFHSAGLEGLRMKSQTETALYRIAQEALTNVVKHANAHAVSVLLEQRDGRAILVVEDDGAGFDVETIHRPGEPARKLGILGMEERASLIGGSLTVESQPGKGTAVFAEVPAAEGG